VANVDKLRRVNKTRSISDITWSWKHSWLERVLRQDGLLKNIAECKMVGKLQRGRKRLNILGDLAKRKVHGTQKNS